MIPQEFKDEIIIEGTRFYIKDDGTEVNADLWDKMFKPISTGKPILNKKWEGVNPDRRNNFIKDLKSY